MPVFRVTVSVKEYILKTVNISNSLIYTFHLNWVVFPAELSANCQVSAELHKYVLTNVAELSLS